MRGNVIIKPVVAEHFTRFLVRGRILLFSAPCGFGKSTTAQALLSGKKVVQVDAREPKRTLPDARERWEVLLLDNLQDLQDTAQQQALCELIRECTERRFVLLSRGMQPSWLAGFGYAGLMQTLDADALLLEREDVRRLFQNYEVQLTESELTEVMKQCIGYPLAAVATARLMAGGKKFSPQLIAQVMREIYAYFETEVYQRLDVSMRRFLLELAPFETFDLDLARMISGDVRAGEQLEWLESNTTMLRYDNMQQLRFWPQFRSFLLWELEREYSGEKRRALLERGALYYELHEDYAHALSCYTMSGNHAKVAELLVRNAQTDPGMWHYSEMAQYYRSLPEEEVLSAPALMQGMSMLCAMEADYAASERWYRELEAFAGRCKPTDTLCRQARGRLAWLDISLPQRSVEQLAEHIMEISRQVRQEQLTLPPFSSTSGLPSILNGAKDLSVWTRKDDVIGQQLRAPLEEILGRESVGLAECAVAESKFEKGEDIAARMLGLVSQLGKIQRDGTPEVEFALVGLLARNQLNAGRAEDARGTLLALRTRFSERGYTRFFRNIDALLCRIALCAGDQDAVDAWYRDKAPRDLLNLNLMWRYQYFTQAMVELGSGRPEDALMTLAPLEMYCRSCGRHLDSIHLSLLRAITLYRQKQESWRAEMARALEITAEYHYVRTISQYGAAVLPLLEAMPPQMGTRRWAQQLLSATRAQASHYPGFLQPLLIQHEELTNTELRVLRLVCADKSNAEIGQLLGIQMSTVKTHVSHIFDKLHVSRRSEAKTVARKLWLVE